MRYMFVFFYTRHATERARICSVSPLVLFICFSTCAVVSQALFSVAETEKKVFSVCYQACSGWKNIQPWIFAALQQNPDQSPISISLINHSRNYSFKAFFSFFCRLNPPNYPSNTLHFVMARIPELVSVPVQGPEQCRLLTDAKVFRDF